MRKTICFAYYADGKFIGWYADTFGSVRNVPKLYNDSEQMIEIITSNFRHKMEEVNSYNSEQMMARFREDAKDKTSEEKNSVAVATLTNLAIHDSEDILCGKDVELRIVECPMYDGPNPDFDEQKFKKDIGEQRSRLVVFLSENSIGWEDGPSAKRTDLVAKFRETNPYIKADNWIYADYSKVKEWAASEPTSFIGVIKSN